jgi:DNA polymerase-3 subunit chi
MARVDFYVLKRPGREARLVFACRLAEKAWRLDNTVHIATADEATARELDELLWTFRDGSFVPHERVAADTDQPESPVTIAAGPTRLEGRDLLINLDDSVPPGIEAFPRIAELVTSDAETRALGRERFATYRNLGHELETHDV